MVLGPVPATRTPPMSPVSLTGNNCPSSFFIAFIAQHATVGSISASKNWPGYISEAKRCHATNGYLLIVETTKSMSASDRLSRLRNVIKENGFEIYNDEQRR